MESVKDIALKKEIMRTLFLRCSWDESVFLTVAGGAL